MKIRGIAAVLAISVSSFLLLTSCTRTKESRGPDSPARLRDIARAQAEEAASIDMGSDREARMRGFGESRETVLAAASRTEQPADDYVNLGILAVRMQNYEEAERFFDKAEEMGSVMPHVPFNRALIRIRTDRRPEAIPFFEQVARMDPYCPDTQYNLGVLYEQSGDLEKAARAFERTIVLQPSHKGAHYRMIFVARRQGRMDRANEAMRLFKELDESSLNYPTPDYEESMYTEFVEQDTRQASEEILTRSTADWGIVFRETTEAAGLPAPVPDGRFSGKPGSLEWFEGFVTTVDFTGDGWMDLAVSLPSDPVSPGIVRLFANREGRFTEMTEKSGIVTEATPYDAAWGDFDNDGFPDLYVATAGRDRLWRNRGDGTFEDASHLLLSNPETPTTRALFVDLDHDGDLDLVLATPENPETGVRVLVYRRDGKFEEATKDFFGDSPPRGVTAVAWVDVDNDNDVDLVTAGPRSPVTVWENRRGGRLGNYNARLGIPQAHASEILVADMNRDFRMDLLLIGTRENPGTIWLNGMGRGADLYAPAYAFDFDNDGDPDLIRGERIYENRKALVEVSKRLGLEGKLDGARHFVAEDFDLDGDLDLLVSDGRSLRLFANIGGNERGWLRVETESRASNRSGIGTKVEIRSGAFRVKREKDANPVHLGLGTCVSPAVLRLWWPTGVAQNVLDVTPCTTVLLPEKLGPPVSCPYVFVWTGERFEFVADTLSVAALGVLIAKDTFWEPDTDETLALPLETKPLNGRYTIQMTEEIEELTYLDRVRLFGVVPAEGEWILTDDKFGPRIAGENAIFSLTRVRPVASARDHDGRDVTDALLYQDRIYAIRHTMTEVPGVTEPNALILDLGDLTEYEKPVLWMTGTNGWVSGAALFSMLYGPVPNPPYGPVLEVLRTDGEWRVLAENAGAPAGMNKDALIDLTGLRPGERTVRLRSNLNLLWDRARVADLALVEQNRIVEFPLEAADLHFRGFSRWDLPGGVKPYEFVYDDVTPYVSFLPQRGMLTAFGDVKDLLLGEPDDRTVVFGPGDELTLQFSTIGNDSSDYGERRIQLLLYSMGWIKDMAPTTLSGETVEPLPYSGMKAYPYPEDEHPRLQEASFREYLETRQTRELKWDPFWSVLRN